MAKKSGKDYVPDRGDLVWLDFDPQLGREQAGHRPAFIVSPLAFNRLSSLVFLCPVTSKVKGFSFEVPLADDSLSTHGVVLIHHLRSVDWRARKIKFIEKAPQKVIEEVLDKLEPLVS